MFIISNAIFLGGGYFYFFFLLKILSRRSLYEVIIFLTF